ncbi:Ig domain-containing protein [Methylobacterium hispanicum]|uniref:Ig domain-containing protein n=1 Tax=Methylobacterium hispanicum TaxID=270350 RepID=UPI001EDD8EDE|nr:Ig domain-containing protein [Methylobacterium hispanicum]
MPTQAAQSTTPVAMSANVPLGRVDDPYLASFRGTGGVSPYTYELISGGAPTGTKFDPATGDIAGTPPVSGSYPNVKVRVTDRNGATATSNAYTITISGRPLSITPNVPLSATIGQPYAATVTAKGGAKPVVFSIYSGSLPDGVILDTATGAITGTPSARGTSTFSIRAVDSTKPTAYVATTATQSISVDYAPLATTCPPCAGVRTAVGNPYDATFAASGGRGPYLHYVQQGVLPPGLVLDRDTGRLTGRPSTAGVYPNLVVQVVDLDNRYVLTPAFEMTVQATVAVSGAPASWATLGEPYAASFAAVGGREPYAWTAIGSLPPGLAIDAASGAVGGTPSQVGSYGGLQVRAVDADGRSAVSDPFSVSVASPLVALGSAPDATVGQEYRAMFSATGGRAPYAFSLGAGDLPPGLSLGTGGAIAGTPVLAGTFAGLSIRATDVDGRVAHREPVAIAVFDKLVVNGDMPSSGTVDEPYAASFAATGGRSPFAWSVSGRLPAGLSISPSTGAISGSPGAAGTSSGLSVVARDLDGRTAAAGPFTLAIASPVRVSGEPQAFATLGQTYSASFSAEGGAAPYAWTVADGALPDGLSMTEEGAVSGTPSSTGTFDGLRVRARDAAGRTGLSGIFSIKVGRELHVSGIPVLTATVGKAYASTFTASGGRAPYVFGPGVGTLPAGLSIGADGVLSGTPSAVETRAGIQVRAVDGDGRTAYSEPFRIAVSDPLTISGLPPERVTVGDAYAFEFRSDGGSRPHRFAVAGGALPAGISLSDSGRLAGVPSSPGTTTGLTVEAVDADGRTARSPAFSVTVHDPLGISGKPATAAVVGEAYGAQFGAAGGRAPYVFSVSATLPDGLVLDPASGRISGIPTVAGSSGGLVVSVRDADGRTASADPFVLTVTGGLAVVGAPAPSVVVDEPYEAAFSASGGTGPYTFAIVGGALPPGLTLATSGVLDGRPSSIGSYAFRIQATDAAGITALSPQYGLAVVSRLRLVGDLPRNWDFGIFKEYVFEAAGGRGPYAFSASATKPLPGGIAIDAATGRISGTPSERGDFDGRTIVVTDADGRVAAGDWTISVWDPIKAWIETIPSGTVGSPFEVALRCSGPQWGCGFGSKWVMDKLPPGLRIVSSSSVDRFSGAISGIPTLSGVYGGIVVTATDSNGRSADIDEIAIDIRDGVSVEAAWVGDGVVGQAYSSQLRAGGGRSPLVFSLASGALPAGISLDPASGRISGSPTEAVSLSGISFSATDPEGRTGVSPIFTLTTYQPLTITGSPATTASVGSPYAARFTPSGGHPPYFHSLLGSLPDGLALSSSTGTISGTPTAATTVRNIYVLVTDVDGRRASSSAFSIAVEGPLAVSGIPSTSGRVGSPYAATFAASGGAGPYVFTLTSGTLPSGLSLSPDGRITGSPTAPGIFSYAVTVTDAVGATATTETFTLDVRDGAEPLSIGVFSTIAGTVGESFYSRYFGLGGTQPYVYSISSGGLPDGLILTGQGTVAGIPTTAGSFTFRVKVADAGGQSAETTDQTIKVDAPLELTETWIDVQGVVGDSGDLSLPVRGGTPPYTLIMVDEGSVIPPGLVLDDENLRLTGRYAASNGWSVPWSMGYAIIDAEGRGTPKGTISWQIGPELRLSGPLDPVYVRGVAVTNYWYNGNASVAPGGKSPWAVTYAPVGSDAQFPPGLLDGLKASSECSGGWWGCPVAPGEWWYGWPGHPATATPSGYGAVYWTPTTVGTYASVRTSIRDADGRVKEVESGPISVVDPFEWQSLLPDATRGQPYSVDLRKLGGKGPYAFRKLAGVLPEGLVLDAATGLVSGRATGAAGTYEQLQFSADWAGGWFRGAASPLYSLKVVDPDNRPADPLTVAVVGGNPPTRILKGAADGRSDDYDEAVIRVFKASGGTPPYAFSLSPGIGNMPMICDPKQWWCSDARAGDADLKRSALTVDQSGLFSRLQVGFNPIEERMVYKAVPSALVRNIRIRVTDSSGAVADSAPFDLDFRKPVGLSGIFPANLTVGDAVDVLATALDGWEPIGLTASKLPPGLSVSVSGRGVRIFGQVATAGRYVDQSVSIRDDYPSTATWQFSTTVHKPVTPLSLTSPADKTVDVGDYLAMTWTPAGGFPPYRVTLASGMLPPGLQVDYRGIVSGTSGSVGTWSGIVMQVQDSNGATAQATPVSITVESARAPTGDGFCRGPYCQMRFTAGPWPTWGPIPANQASRAVAEIFRLYVQPNGTIGWPWGAGPEERVGPAVGDPSEVTFAFVNAPSWLKWPGPSVVFGFDDFMSEWAGYQFIGYYDQRTMEAVPPPVGSVSDQPGIGIPNEPASGGDPGGGGSDGGGPGGPIIMPPMLE